jgi:hypothetical protein
LPTSNITEKMTNSAGRYLAHELGEFEDIWLYQKGVMRSLQENRENHPDWL